ncbi:calcium-binding protein [Acidimangrovimonas pyrenivorans]|uniref:Calcium-binding protein n=1 Tax=Acidimangrovimonas pyrenivorans TaxID=2030798 RepID=A0ABV7AM36_9RHOB
MSEIRIEGHPVYLVTDTGYDHLYLVFVDDDGSEYVLRSGPSGPLGTGVILVEDSLPMADSADARPVEDRDLYGSRVLDLGPRDAADVWDVMRQQAREIGDRQVPFQTFLQNSNSFVASLLHVIGTDIADVLPDQPDADDDYPGTDNILDSFGFNLTGTTAGDILAGGAGNDTLFGQGGSDTVSGGSGHDSVDLGAGDDLFDDDLFTAGDPGDPPGGDTVWAGLGADTVQGGAGADRLHGQEGTDLLRGRLGADRLWGGAGDDTLAGGNGADTLFGRAGDDVVAGGNGRDSICLGTGDDLFIDSPQSGPLGADTVWAGSGNDTLQGGAGNDSFHGTAGNDLIHGRLGDDRLWGGADSDTLDGGPGDDRLTGGSGADTFLFNLGADTIADFTPGSDRLGLDSALWGGGLTPAEVLARYATTDGSGVSLDFGDGDLLILSGITDPAVLEPDLFLL